MFIVTLAFGPNRTAAPQHMAGHNAWLAKGFEDGIFVLSGSLAPQRGGVVLAAGLTRDTLEQRVAQDPFVAEGVVEAEIAEIAPGRPDPRLPFLAA